MSDTQSGLGLAREHTTHEARMGVHPGDSTSVSVSAISFVTGGGTAHRGASLKERTQVSHGRGLLIGQRGTEWSNTGKLVSVLFYAVSVLNLHTNFWGMIWSYISSLTWCSISRVGDGKIILN